MISFEQLSRRSARQGGDFPEDKSVGAGSPGPTRKAFSPPVARPLLIVCGQTSLDGSRSAHPWLGCGRRERRLSPRGVVGGQNPGWLLMDCIRCTPTPKRVAIMASPTTRRIFIRRRARGNSSRIACANCSVGTRGVPPGEVATSAPFGEGASGRCENATPRNQRSYPADLSSRKSPCSRTQPAVSAW